MEQNSIMRSLFIILCLLLVVFSSTLAEETDTILEELVDLGKDEILQSAEVGEIIRSKRYCCGCYGMMASPAPCGGCCG